MSEKPQPQPLFRFRAGQRKTFRHKSGILAKICRRQYGKSYELGATGLDWMLETPCDVFYVSAAVRLGIENIRKEAAIWIQCLTALREQAGAGAADAFESTAFDDHKKILDIDAVADLFESQKLETRFRHGHAESSVSRSIVVAPNPDTAVGWTGHVIMDEVGRMPEFRDVWEAMEPIVSSNRGYKIRLATTPPPDDTHYSYEMLAPEAGTEFPVRAEGNYYTSAAGILCHRVDAWDAAADGIQLYDLRSREPLTPEQHRARAIDKTAWDRNYGCQFIRGGSAAINLLGLLTAQARGKELGCVGINCTENLAA
jgi:hypothetical protein